MQTGSFEALLQMLGDDEEKAALAYRELHLRLVRFFRLNNGGDPESLADEALDRLARVAADPEKGIESPTAFALGIARHLLQEDVRRQIRESEAGRDWSYLVSESDEGEEALLGDIETCLARMPSDRQELLRSYYEWTGKRKIDHHRQLAERLGLTMNALRNRLLRARTELDDCVRRRQRDVSVKSDTRNQRERTKG